MFTPQLELETQFVLDGRGRITSTREPNPTRGPKFSLIRGVASCAWAVHADVSDALAAELCAFAPREPAHDDFRDPPIHADRYGSLLGGRINFGPAFTFPDTLPDVSDVAELRDASLLDRFRGWTAEEIPERAPICAVMDLEQRSIPRGRPQARPGHLRNQLESFVRENRGKTGTVSNFLGFRNCSLSPFFPGRERSRYGRRPIDVASIYTPRSFFASSAARSTAGVPRGSTCVEARSRRPAAEAAEQRGRRRRT